MKYLVHYSDATEDIDYTKVVAYNGPAEELLKKLCQEHEDGYQRMLKGLSEKAPDTFRYNGEQAYWYEITSNEARVYTKDDNINVLIINASPVIDLTPIRQRIGPFGSKT